MIKQILILGAGILVSSTAYADGTPIDISSAVDSNLYTFTGGTSYPPAGSTVSVKGVDFTLAPFYANNPSAPDVGVVLTGDGSPTTATINTPDVVIGPDTTFYSLINSGFGVYGDEIGNLTLDFSSGDSFIYVLTEGTNVRDHYNGMYNNVATNVYGTLTYGDDRLDAQQIILPANFIGETLTSIVLNNTYPAGGNPFLAAFTYTNPTAAVPESATWAMFIAGMGLVGWTMRRRPQQRLAISFA